MREAMLETAVGRWSPALDPEQAAAATEVARGVVARLRERAQVELAVAAAEEQSTLPYRPLWLPYGLAQGWAGLAVMAGYFDACFPGEEWDVVGHEYLALAARGAEALPYVPPGLWAGLSGTAFAAWMLSRGGTRYRRLLAALDAAILPQATATAAGLAAQRGGVSVGQYDVISGLTGTGAYLLARRDDPAAAEELAALLTSLVALGGEDDGLPRWYSPPHLLDEYMLQSYPSGNLNCGLAHGIPGPLGLLALAYQAGVIVPGQAEAIDRIAAWLAGHTVTDEWGVNWPTGVALDTPDRAEGSSRSAWCYGGPGVARALWLAGVALDQIRIRDLAVQAMEAVYRRPPAARRIDSPTFCHGVAGLLQITLRFAHDTGLPQFQEAARALTRQLLDLREPETLLGYRSIEQEGRRVDQPGLLDGAPGVALVLLAAAGGVEPGWDRIFLLS
jgi:hypothetical protein